MTHKKDDTHEAHPAKTAHHKEVAEKVEEAEAKHPKASAATKAPAADGAKIHPVDSLRKFNEQAKLGDTTMAEFHLKNAEAAVAVDGSWPTVNVDTDGLVKELEDTHRDIGLRGDGLNWHASYDRAKVVARAIRWA